MKEKILKYRNVYFFAAPLLLLISINILRFSELSYYGDMLSPFMLLKELISYAFLLSLFAFLCAVVRHKPTAYLITAVIIYLMAFASSLLAELTGDPLLPSDLLMVKNVGDISSFIVINFTVPRIISIMLVLASVVFYYFLEIRFPEKPRSLKRKIFTSAVSVAVFAAFSYYLCLSPYVRTKLLPKIDVTTVAFNPISNFDENGLILTFFPRIGLLVTHKPDGYHEEAINTIINDENNIPAAETNAPKTPAVIAIQNEAWWDPTLIPNVTITPDPLENTRRLAEEGHGGMLFSPVYAGGTCMPEFEFLTGLTSTFLPRGSYPYIQAILKKTNSIVWEFKQNGYETIAFHPYKRNFYNRNKAYPLIGFDEFIGYDGLDPEKLYESGDYVADMFVTEQIIEEYENRSTDLFYMFTVTMQNHGGYLGGRYENYDVEVSSDSLNEDDLAGLKDFTQGVYEADRALKALVDYFKEVEQPVIIVMYGDHLPLLGNDMSTLKDGGFVGTEEGFTNADYPGLYETPYVVWTNYDSSEFDFPEKISPANLGIKIMDMCSLSNVEKYFDFIRFFYDKYPVYRDYFVYDRNMERLSQADDLASVHRYKLIQYDLLSGKNYSLKNN